MDHNFTLFYGYSILAKKVMYVLSTGIFIVVYRLFQHNSCAIHVASQGKPEIVKLLLDAKCDVNVVDAVSSILQQILIHPKQTKMRIYRSIVCQCRRS